MISKLESKKKIILDKLKVNVSHIQKMTSAMQPLVGSDNNTIAKNFCSMMNIRLDEFMKLPQYCKEIKQSLIDVEKIFRELYDEYRETIQPYITMEDQDSYGRCMSVLNNFSHVTNYTPINNLIVDQTNLTIRVGNENINTNCFTHASPVYHNSAVTISQKKKATKKNTTNNTVSNNANANSSNNNNNKK